MKKDFKGAFIALAEVIDSQMEAFKKEMIDKSTKDKVEIKEAILDNYKNDNINVTESEEVLKKAEAPNIIENVDKDVIENENEVKGHRKKR